MVRPKSSAPARKDSSRPGSSRPKAAAISNSLRIASAPVAPFNSKNECEHWISGVRSEPRRGRTPPGRDPAGPRRRRYPTRSASHPRRWPRSTRKTNANTGFPESDRSPGEEGLLQAGIQQAQGGGDIQLAPHRIRAGGPVQLEKRMRTLDFRSRNNGLASAIDGRDQKALRQNMPQFGGVGAEIDGGRGHALGCCRVGDHQIAGHGLKEHGALAHQFRDGYVIVDTQQIEFPGDAALMELIDDAAKHTDAGRQRGAAEAGEVT